VQLLITPLPNVPVALKPSPAKLNVPHPLDAEVFARVMRPDVILPNVIAALHAGAHSANINTNFIKLLR
jgi:hypothetical protein